MRGRSRRVLWFQKRKNPTIGYEAGLAAASGQIGSKVNSRPLTCQAQKNKSAGQSHVTIGKFYVLTGIKTNL
jgi:hypothetical protein